MAPFYEEYLSKHFIRLLSELSQNCLGIVRNNKFYMTTLKEEKSKKFYRQNTLTANEFLRAINKTSMEHPSLCLF